MYASLIRKTSSVVSFALVLASSSLVSAKTSGNSVAQVFTDWVAVVADGYTAEQCAAEVTRAGAAVSQILPTIKVLALTTPTADNSTIAALPCISSIELDGTVVAQ